MRGLRRVAVLALLAVAAGVLVGWSKPRAASADAATPTKPAVATDVQSRPDRVSAKLSARLLKHKVEVTGERSEYSTTWANPDGTFTIRNNAGPVRFQRDGAWVDIDPTLQTNPDGSVVPKAHPGGLRFAGGDAAGLAPSAVGDRDLVSLGSGTDQVRLGWRGMLPTPTLSGTVATYSDVLPGVDLVLQATRTGYESSFVVKDRSAVSAAGTITVPLLSAGMAAAADGEGGLVFTDSAGTQVGHMPAPVMWDATVDSHSGEHTHRAAVGLAARQDGTTLDLVLTPDPAFLTNTATVFPVTVDPYFTEIGSSAVFDTFVGTGPDCCVSDQSGSTELALGTYGGGNVRRSFLRFPMAPVFNTHIITATMHLWNISSWVCGGSEPWDAWVSDWADTSTRWPGPNRTQFIGESNQSLCGGEVTIGVTGGVQSAATNNWGQLTVGLVAKSESDVNQYKRFSSSEGGAVPYIDIVFNHIPVAHYPTIKQSMEPSGQNTFTSSVFPTICELADDPDGETALQYQIAKPDGTIVADWWQGTWVPNGTEGCKESPVRLDAGSTYKVHAIADDSTDRSPSWSDWHTFTVDQTLPPAPTISPHAGIRSGTGWSGFHWVAGPDWTGDGKADVLAYDTAGTLYVYPGAGGGFFTGTGTAFNSGWSGIEFVVTPDWTGDGKPDVLEYSPTDGDLYVVPGNGAGRFAGAKVLVNHGWTGFTLAAAGDWNGDGKADLLARGGDGNLYLYPGTGTGGMGTRLTLASGWGAYTALTASRDWDGDGHADMIARDSTGDLWLFPGTNTGVNVAGAVKIGSGTNSYDRLMASPDFTSDGHPDLLARETSGDMFTLFGATTGSITNTFAKDGWTDTTTGSFLWSDTASDLYQMRAKLDNGFWSSFGDTAMDLTSLAGGWHKLTVEAYDKAGNVTTGTFEFGIGAGALTSPKDQDRTQARVTLSAISAATRGYVTYRYRLGTGGSYLDIPTGDVTIPGTNTHPSWPQAKGGDGKFPALTWNVAGTVGSSGLVQVVACLGTSASDPSPVCTPTPTNLQLLGQAFGASYATRTLGPGRLSLLTGDYAVDATDVSVPSYSGTLGIGRVFTTLAPSTGTTGLRGVFGPGWRASFDGPGLGDADLTITDLSAQGYVVMTAPDGGQTLYSGPPGGTSFTGQGDANDGSVLTKDSSTQFTMTDADGTKTIWAQDAAGWTVSKVVEAGSNDTTLYSHNAAGQITQFVAPAPVDCSTNPLTTQGCRTVTFTYDPTSGRLLKVSFSTYDPATSAMRTVDVAQYSYDGSWRLASAWDPRISPNLKVTYSYDTDGRLSTITPPGLAAWTLHYDSQHRLSSVTRPDPTGATATSTVAYDLPFTGSGAPVDLSSTQTKTWAQTDDLPTVGTAVFDPDHIPATTPTSTDWPYADLAYLDVNGREVNTASYGAGTWQVATTSYDKWGNTTRALSPGNRAEALNPTNDTDPQVAAFNDSGVRAGYLDSQTVYTADGVDATDTFGPTHPVVIDSGATADARAHTHTDYDEGKPDSAKTYHLPTTITVTARTLDGTELDPKVVRNSYDPVVAGDGNGWDLRQVVKTTQVMGGGQADIVRVTRYNSLGQAIESRMPSDATSGTGAGTTKTTYYTATGTGTCASKPYWTGLACQTIPAAQPTGKPLPTTTTTYNLYDQPTVVTEQAGSTTRTSTVGYDPAGRPTTQSLLVSPAADGGTPVPDVTTSYDPATGLATTLTAGTDTVITGYDSLGRVNSYTDADHQNSTVTYDIDGRPATATDGKGTQTYTYDGVTGEHRGLITKLSDSQAGDFTASYDAAGAMTTEVFPGGLTSTITHDNTGAATSLTYTKSGSTWLSFTQTHDVGGQVRTQAGPDGSQTYSYDNAGRLTTVDDHYSPGGTNTSCTLRSYGFDANSNRLSATNRPGTISSTGTGCDYTSGTDTTTSHTYDTADRITDTGYAYDNLGRTTTTPAAAVAGGTDLGIGYYADDMVASQTQAGHTLSFTLDPARRLRAQTDSITGLTETNHYDGTGDSPSWIAKSDGTWQRFASAIGGDMAAQIDSTGAVTLQLTNLHGDVVATCDTGATGISAYHEQTEYGIPRDATQVGTRYAWLGAAQRSADDLGGLILMGVRLYDPTTGRFLQPDPVPGGSANDYDYADQDPINNRDLDGRMYTSADDCGVSCMKKVVTRMKAAATATVRKLTKRAGGSTSFRKVANRGWHVVRFSKNAPLTLIGYGLAEAAGGHCSLQKGLMVYCSGMPRALALSGGWTLGNTYMSHRTYNDQLRERLRHESKHSDQYVIFGGASFLVLYGADAIIHKGNQGKMWFERWAGLKDGHYQ